MKKCVHCGKENIDEAIYCANCGLKIDSSSKSNLESNLNLNSNSNSNTSSDSNSVSSSDSSSNSSSDSSSYSNTISSKTNSSNSQANHSSNTKPKGGASKLRLYCCFVPIALLIIFLAVALIYYESAESFPIIYGHDYKVLDLDGDGRLSFDEASQLDLSIPNDKMTKYFNEADTNNNGFLKGHEFELFYDDVNNYDEVYGDSSSNSDKYKYSSSSSSSKSKNSRSYSSNSGNNKYVNNLNDQEYDSSSEGYVLTCPYCGSEAIYETGGYYKCAECGHSIYDPDDLELAYSEGYMDLLVPVSLTIN